MSDRYSKMTFPIHGSDDLRSVKGISKIKSFSKIKDEEVKYMVYMYDIGTPLRQERDIRKRKLEAASLSGIDPESIEAEELINLSKDVYVEAINELLKFQNHRVWSLIVANEEVFDELINNSIKKVQVAKGDKEILQALKVKDDLLTIADRRHESLNTYYEEFYGGDEELMEKSVTRFTPESIANVS